MKFNVKPLLMKAVPIGSFPLDEEDDRYLWRAVVDHIMATWEPELGALLEIGRCSHWLRPHQTRWTADGGFAWPTGYGNGWSWSRMGLPQMDWSRRMTWTESGWVRPVGRKLKGSCPTLRITIPSRTYRHEQAAIHTRWRIDGEFSVVFFGFRHKLQEGWSCTADSSLRRAKSRGDGRKPRTHRQKAKLGRYRRQANDCSFIAGH